MQPSLQSEPNESMDCEPVFVEEKLDDGSIRYHMNEKLQKRAEAAVAKLSFEKIIDFERRVAEAVQSRR